MLTKEYPARIAKESHENQTKRLNIKISRLMWNELKRIHPEHGAVSSITRQLLWTYIVEHRGQVSNEKPMESEKSVS